MAYKKAWDVSLVAADTTVYSDPIYIGEATVIAAQLSFTQPRVLAIASTLVVEDLTYTAKTAGVAGDTITIAYIDPPGNSVALSVAVTGTDIVVTLATNGSSVVTSTAAQIKAAVDAKVEAAALVSVAVTGTGTTVQAAAAEAPLASGADETDGSIDGKIYFQGSCELVMPYTGTSNLWDTMDSGVSVAGSAAGRVFTDLSDVATDWVRLAFVPAVGGSDVTYFTAHVNFKNQT
jgi:hypothetical protein